MRFWIWIPISCALPQSLLAADLLPATVLDLSHWKLTVPVAQGESRRAAEIGRPRLAQFQDRTTFFVDPRAKAVVFRAPCGGATTKGSKYPRSELREMSGSDEKTSASWGTDDEGVHTLTATLAVTHAPAHKPQVVCAQIHDAKDDLLMIRLEGRKLFVERNEAGDAELDANYALGTFFDLKIQAGSGHVQIWYNGAPKLDWRQSRKGCYFKAGCYTQSNVQKGDAPDDYGEVMIRRLSVTHTP
jgi:poly(beta-D-mannuronate) lyase